MFEIEARDVLKIEAANLEATPLKPAYSSPRLVELGEAACLVQGLAEGNDTDYDHGRIYR